MWKKILAEQIQNLAQNLTPPHSPLTKVLDPQVYKQMRAKYPSVAKSLYTLTMKRIHIIYIYVYIYIRMYIHTSAATQAMRVCNINHICGQGPPDNPDQSSPLRPAQDSVKKCLRPQSKVLRHQNDASFDSRRSKIQRLHCAS
jgi:hypothetical protein